MGTLSVNVINNQITNMRREVKTARVNLIHSLTRKNQFLKNRKGTEAEKKKNETKANGYISEVMVLKKINVDEVSFFGLSIFEEDQLMTYVNSKIVNIETRVKAKLCLQNNLRTVIKKFYEDHNEQINLLDKLLDKWYKIRDKNKTKKLKEVNRKENTSHSNTDEPLAPPNLSSDESPKKLKNKSKKKSKKIPGQTNKKLKKKNVNDDKIDVNSPDKKNLSSPTKYVNPFFVTENNEAYHSYQRVTDDQNQLLIGEDEDNDTKRNQMSLDDNKKNFCPEKTKKKNSLHKHKKPYERREKTFSGSSNRESGFEEQTNFKNNKLIEKLHPSWEAKKKMNQGTAVPFQGKRIVFSD